ncbi:MAG: GNAT family N-acetyltransferase [Defluviitaleaceae bacterium]|nr:GNAT family N-acetyltransferase [Defluviitaleaceae bacterium]
MEIRKITQQEYPALLDVFNDAFDYGREKEWFQREHAHCTPYPATVNTEEIGHHWVSIIDGRIAGGLGAYPLDWVVSNSNSESRTISLYGIGQVCCLPEFRNQGVMSALMTAAEADMLQLGRTVGYLTGDRRRYGYFGYDFGGNVVKYRLDNKLLKHAASPGATIRQATYADWAELNQAYECQPSYVKRSARSWELHFSRAGLQWFIGELGSRKGYVCIQSKVNASEIYGDPGVLAAMLHERAASLEKGETLQVFHAAQDVISTPAGQMLYSTAAVVDSRPAGLFNVINPAKLLDELAIDHANLSDSVREAMARQAVNFTHLPGKWQVQPLCAWVSGVDSI